MKANFLLLITLMVGTVSVSAKEIAITFDDGPYKNSPLFTTLERAQTITQKIKQEKVPSAIFYLVTSRIDGLKEGREAVKTYIDNGQFLGNHSNSHPVLGGVPVDQYISDFTLADSILSSYKSYVPFYRYPQLNIGETVEERDKFRAELDRKNIRVGGVSICAVDWFVQLALNRYVDKYQKVNYKGLEQAYLELIMGQIEFYDNLAKKVLGRSPKHVLALHEYDVTALYLDLLIRKLREEGWTIISPLEAYKDPIYSIRPDVLGIKNIISGLAEERGIPVEDIKAPQERTAEAVSVLNKWKSYSKKSYYHDVKFLLKKLMRVMGLMDMPISL